MNPARISFSPLRLSDLDLMHRCWLNTPHVQRWWSPEGASYEEIEAEYRPLTEDKDATRPFVILHENKPIGYIQFYPISDDEEYANLVAMKDSAGVDLFIGEEEYLHRNLGQHILRRFLAEQVFSDLGMETCVIGPEPKNTAAIRAYEKAGFRFFKTIQVPTEPEPEYLMKLTREEFERDSLE